MKTDEKPASRITPYLLYEDVVAALQWLENAFGFIEYGERVHSADGRVSHAAMQVEDSFVMMGCPGPDYKNPQRLGVVTSMLYIRVDHVDQHFARTCKAGAKVIHEPKTMFYGDRRYGVADPEGHQWYFAETIATPADGPKK